ncbi:DNA/RNA non-specific endonuclease [Actinomadura hibisca]|uniref:DNA/RNA non-specific endonuclease n=1 Tax=Actinomadura hibisca TaxID=68565 RepID=UPI000A65D5D8|nr:DNA/RNA non-specific endonuclease [Actinomadura hibisca]
MRTHHAVIAAAMLSALSGALVAAPAEAGTRVTAASPVASALRYPQPPCVAYLPPNTSYRAYTANYLTDGIGRPLQVVAPNLLRRNASRSACEQTVGAMGPAGYQGGHMLAATLRGVSERYNLTPMQGNQINLGIMKKIENGAKRCLRIAAVKNYTVRLTYPAGASVVPERIAVSMTPKAKAPAVPFTISFPNRVLAPQAYSALRNKIANRFTASGC